MPAMWLWITWFQPNDRLVSLHYWAQPLRTSGEDSGRKKVEFTRIQNKVEDM
jgi:hypothetical protein